MRGHHTSTDQLTDTGLCHQNSAGAGGGEPSRTVHGDFPGPGCGWPGLSLPGARSFPGQMADETRALTAAHHLHCTPTACQACALCSEDDSCSWKPPGRQAGRFPFTGKDSGSEPRPGSARPEEPARLRDREAQSTASGRLRSTVTKVLKGACMLSVCSLTGTPPTHCHSPLPSPGAAGQAERHKPSTPSSLGDQPCLLLGTCTAPRGSAHVLALPGLPAARRDTCCHPTRAPRARCPAPRDHRPRGERADAALPGPRRARGRELRGPAPGLVDRLGRREAGDSLCLGRAPALSAPTPPREPSLPCSG